MVMCMAMHGHRTSAVIGGVGVFALRVDELDLGALRWAQRTQPTWFGAPFYDDWNELLGDRVRNQRCWLREILIV